MMMVVMMMLVVVVMMMKIKMREARKRKMWGKNENEDAMTTNRR